MMATQKLRRCESCRLVICKAGGLEDALRSSSTSLVIIPALEAMGYAEEDQLHPNEPTSCFHQVFIIKCTSCDKSVALRLKDAFLRIEDVVRDETKPNGWLKVEDERDRLVLFILSQIIYREYEVPVEEEDQVEYAFPPESDLAKVLWINGSAVGFYTVKPKGTFDLETMEWYSMTVLDTLFIRNAERRKGHGLSAVQDLLQEFPDENVGFSVPISCPMIKVLNKHLSKHPQDRTKLWEVIGGGSEGNCQLLWYSLKRSSQ